MTQSLFSYRKYWAHRLGPARVLPRSRVEMAELGWDACDVILVTGDAYVDHPSFGIALIGRVLEAQGFRVGIIDQPDYKDNQSVSVLGQPLLCFGISAGNMDSMVNRYTADGRSRSNDAYTPDDLPDKRPDRASIVYANLCRSAYTDTPIILGGIEASLRRAGHYDYWSDKVRRSILHDAKADILCYGNGERSIVEIVHRLAARESIKEIQNVRGTVFITKADEYAGPARRLPSFEEISTDKIAFVRSTQIMQQSSYHPDDYALLQRHGDRDVCILPPTEPLTTAEMDRVYALPYTRKPHPDYINKRLTAYEMIKHSITIMRGCFGGCSFCAIVSHEGPVIQSRSHESILAEIAHMKDHDESFTGVISDLGGPTANMYFMNCTRPPHAGSTKGHAEPALKDNTEGCQRWSCLYPKPCGHLNKSHQPLIELYRKARALPGIKKILIGSGVRYDLAVHSPDYVKELVQHHVGGYLKIAPEHVAERPLALMQKPGLETYARFKELFDRYSQEAGKEQYLIPYLIAAHPGCSDEDMLEVTLWLKAGGFRPDQVQTFLPSPMTLATTMYYTSKNPLTRGNLPPAEVIVPRGLKTRRLHKAFLRFHDPENWPQLRDALKRLGRDELIGNGKRDLIPTFQPRGTGHTPEGARRPGHHDHDKPKMQAKPEATGTKVDRGRHKKNKPRSRS